MSAVFHDYVNLIYNGTTTLALSGGIAQAASDFAWAVVPYQAQVRRVAVVYQDTNATGAVVTFAYRPTAGSDTGRVTIATLTKPAASQAAKPYVYQDLTTSVTVQEGGEIVVASTATGGVVKLVTLVERKPEQPANLPLMNNITA